MMSGAVPPAVWGAKLSQELLHSPGGPEVFTLGLACWYAAIIASVFLLRVGLPHQARARLTGPPSPPPPPSEPPPPVPGAQAPRPIVVAAAASPPAPIRNCLRLMAIDFLSHLRESVFRRLRRVTAPC